MAIRKLPTNPTAIVKRFHLSPLRGLAHWWSRFLGLKPEAIACRRSATGVLVVVAPRLLLSTCWAGVGLEVLLVQPDCADLFLPELIVEGGEVLVEELGGLGFQFFPAFV